jgi:hypothetical protein
MLAQLALCRLTKADLHYAGGEDISSSAKLDRLPEVTIVTIGTSRLSMLPTGRVLIPLEKNVRA